jgi:hypothetical protein
MAKAPKIKESRVEGFAAYHRRGGPQLAVAGPLLILSKGEGCTV